MTQNKEKIKQTSKCIHLFISLFCETVMVKHFPEYGQPCSVYAASSSVLRNQEEAC
jgi:hypothetical protein